MPDAAEDAQDNGLILRRGVDDRAVVIHAVGEVDHVTASRLFDELAKAGQVAPERPIVIDMTGISFMASSGLTVLVEHHQRGQRAGRDLRIVVGDSVVGRTLRRTGLFEFLSVYAVLADALPDKPSP
ncbi:STAS domain-containing protein [Actinophytocola sp. NPDC049390]|uniref:STAS domain-containing protein n=1 Tax=Actinophytocola sp. NPDC049390 TaxID=3363894 RepID=UPI0037AF11D6